MKLKHVMLPIAAAVAALAATSASALEFHGYFRSGVGGNSKGGDQACFSLPNQDFKFRLGNECETYGELQFDETLYKGKDGVEFKYTAMLAYVAGKSYNDFESFKDPGRDIALRQNWIGAKGLPGLGGATVWAGKRFYRRHDVHSIDFFYWDPSGTGGGIEDVDVGGAKFAYAVFANNLDVSETGGTDRKNVWRHDLRFYGIPTNPDGTLEVGLDVHVVSDKSGTTGTESPGRQKASPWFTVEHMQANLLGGFNKVALQYATGNASSMNQAPSGSSTSDAKQWRLVEHFVYQPSPDFSGAFVLTYQDKKRVYEDRTLNAGNAAGVNFVGFSDKSWSVELRPAWHFNDYFKLEGDIGYQSVEPKSESVGTGGGFPYSSTDKMSMWKVTIAPTIVAGRGYFARPALRLFATYAKWNDAAQRAGVQNQASCQATGSSNSVFECSTSGWTYGLQAEAWW